MIAFGLGDEADFKVWAQFNTADAALRHLDEQQELPDLILLDLNLPSLSGLDAIPSFKSIAPETEIIILTESEKEADILEAISLGAVGYLLKESPLNRIIEGIRTVLAGGASLDPGMARYLLDSNRQQSRAFTKDEKTISPRELEALSLISTGLAQKEVANKLGISHKTVDFHVRQIYKKNRCP